MSNEPEEEKTGYNWHEDPEDGRKTDEESFIHWFVLAAISEHASMGDKNPENREKNKAKFEHLSELTEKFTNIKLTMQMNGEEIEVDWLFPRLDRALTYGAERRAKAMVEEIEHNSKIHDAVDEIYSLLNDATVHLKQKLEAAGVKIWEDD